MRLAIVGDGASALIMLSNLERNLTKLNLKRIYIYSNSHLIGPGKAYQWDIYSPLMNLPNYSINVDDIDNSSYVHWLKDGLSSESKTNPMEYSSRRTFGRYLRHSFLRIINKLNSSGIETEVIYSAAQDVHVDHSVTINKGKKSERTVQKVIFCPGVAIPEYLSEVKKESRYFHDPYPLLDSVNKVEKNSSVMIFGAGLTAVDITRALLERKHSGLITLCSRSGQLPRVRNAKIITRPIYATPGYISEWVKKEKVVKIKDIVNLIRTEFNFRNISLFPLLRWFYANWDSGREIRWQMQLLAAGYEGMELALNIIHPNIEILWDALSNDERVSFNHLWRTKFMCFMNPMPENVANTFNKAISSEQLRILKTNHFEIKSTQSGLSNLPGENEVDYIFNATSPSGKTHYLHSDSSGLINSLIEQQTISSHPLGGIQVNASTGAALNQSNIYFLGHITNGVNLLTNSLVGISRQAKKIADALSFS